MSADEVAARPRAGSRRERVRRLRAGDRRARRRRLRRPRGPGARAPPRRSGARSPGGGRGAPTCWWTRRRTSTGPSWSSPCSSRRPPTTCSWSATTTRRSTAGGWPTCGGCSASPPRCPGLRRVDLETNYRCPRPVVERAVRLVEHNRERFAKRILRRPAGRRPAGPRARRGRRPRAGDAGDAHAGPTTARRAPSSPGRTASCWWRWSRRSSSASRSARRTCRWPSRTSGSTACSIGRSARRSRRRGRRPAAARARAGCEPTLRARPPRAAEADGRLAEPSDGPTRGRPRDRAAGLGGHAADVRRGALGDRRAPATARRAAPGRRRAVARHGARHQGPRVGPRRRARRRLPGPPVHLRRDRAGAGPRGGAAARVRRLDPRPALAHAAVRPGGALAVPAARRSPPASWACPRARPPRRFGVSGERPRLVATRRAACRRCATGRNR